MLPTAHSVVQPPADTRVATHRNTTIDLVRIIAAFGVVAIHVHANTPAAENVSRIFLVFCVPFFFTVALAYFIISLRKAASIKDVFSKNLKRIGVPLLTWSIIYSSLLLVKSLLTHGDRAFDVVRIFLYGESAEQMYYLPELLIMQLLVVGIFMLVYNRKQAIALAVLAGAAFYLLWGSVHNYFGVTSTKALLVYMVAAFYIAAKITKRQQSWSYFVVGIVLLSLAISNLFIAYPTVLQDYFLTLPIGGVGAVLMTLNMPRIALPNWLLVVASTTYGVYLSHVMFLECLEFGFEIIHYNVFYNFVTKLLVAIVVFCIAVLFTLIVRRNTFLRSVLLGEN